MPIGVLSSYGSLVITSKLPMVYMGTCIHESGHEGHGH